jgi:two-component system cell cycle response regulator
VESDQTLRFAQDVAQLRGLGRTMRRRIEERQNGLRAVLIADDEALMRALVAATLSPETYELLEAATGTEALESARTHHPNLAILDRRMPEQDGIAVCAAIKADPELRDIQVIMVTGSPTDEAEARAAGADAYLSKPFSPVELLATIYGLLGD